jgi:protection-of-telomeres protein 1
MFILWGNLEEQKSALQAAAVPKEEAPYSKKQKLSPVRKPGVQPPMDSDDEDEDQQRREPRSVNPNVLSERSPNARIKLPPSEQDKQPSFTGLQVKNKAFTCCIKQYGVKVNEDNPALANAGEGKRWERRFGMFGTQIA